MNKPPVVKLLFILLPLAVILTAGSLPLQNGHDQFQKALAKERGEGKLEEAIALYRKVIDQTRDEALAAKAQLRIGICYEKLGRIEARKAYEKVIEDFADQKDTADEARRRLSALMEPIDVQNGEGLSCRRVMSGPEILTFGAVDQKGRYISYVENSNLCLRDLKTGITKLLTKNGSIEARVLAKDSIFSPDSRLIAYTWLNEDGISDLRLVGLRDSRLRILLRRENGDSIQPLGWTPDGKRILTAFFSTGGTADIRNELGFVSVREGTVEIIKSERQPFSYRSFIGMSLSPDAGFIAVAEPADKNDGPRDIFLMSVDGGREFPLIRHPADDHSPVWTPDGRHIMYISDRGGRPGIWISDVTDGEIEGTPRLVKADIGRFGRWMGFTRQGACYYAIRAIRENIFIADFNPMSCDILGKAEALAGRFVAANFGPAWSPDGKYLAYFRNEWEKRHGSGASAIIIRSLKTGEERALPNDLNQPRAIHWFPEGRSLLVSAFRLPQEKDYHIDFYRVDVESGEKELVLRDEDLTETLRPGLSPDGSKIYYFCKKPPDGTALMSYDLESLKKKEIYIANHDMTMRISVSISPDGGELAFVEDNGAWPPVQTLKILSIANGNSRDLLSVRWPELINGQRALAWTPDGRHLLIVKMTFGAGEASGGSPTAGFKDELMRVPVGSGRIQKVNLSARELDSLSIHPDGRYVAYSALSRDSSYEIWVMENFLPKKDEASRGGQK